METMNDYENVLWHCQCGILNSKDDIYCECGRKNAEETETAEISERKIPSSVKDITENMNFRFPRRIVPY